MATDLTPAQAWKKVIEGNRRFAQGESVNPNRDPQHREVLAGGQNPFVTVLGCSDSRVPMEVTFDAGLGDLFVVRNAGEVAGDSSVASLEYAVGPLDVPLILVLSHQSCGAVAAAIKSATPESAGLPPLIGNHISTIVRSAYEVMNATGTTIDTVDPDEVGAAHLRATVARILERSELIALAVAQGRTAIVAADYRFDTGLVVPHFGVGVDISAV